MEWSPQQDNAIKAVRRWVGDRHAPPVFRLFGYAGTGKTTLAKEIAAGVKGAVLYGAFTGKAALVLRGKGCENASTIHSMIYKVVEDPVTGETSFVLNPDSDVAAASLVIIDECSMVGPDLGRDLMSYGTKVLVLGDPAQLPPVSGEGYFTNVEKPDVLLTEIHRQAAENPIIRMSMDVREGRRLVPGTYGDSRVVGRAALDRDAMREAVMSADQLLVGLNRTRRTFNARIREIKGIAGRHSETEELDWRPVPGDRLVCLKNNREKGLLNGGLWDVKTATQTGGKMRMQVESLDDPGITSPVEVETAVQFFRGTEKELHWTERKKSDEFDYGYALTCHKAQGSQWQDIILFDESAAFREDAARWLYTGITRAAERVTVVV